MDDELKKYFESNPHRCPVCGAEKKADEHDIYGWLYGCDECASRWNIQIPKTPGVISSK